MTAVHSARNIATLVRDEPVDRIMASSFNPRKRFDEAGLQDLADSIKQHGVIEPIVVRTLHSSLPTTAGVAWYEIIAGERRWRATRLAGLETIPTRILGQVDDETALQLALIENLQRQDLDPIEEAEGYHLLNHIVGMKQKQIAAAVNRSQPAIANAMRLLDLPEDVREVIRAGDLSRSHGVALAKFKDFPEVARVVADYAVKNGLTSHATEKLDLHNIVIRESGVVKEINTWRTPFDIEGCKKCPFGAYRAGPHEYGYCLKPEHWDELAAESAEARKLKLAEMGDAEDGIIDLKELNWDEFQYLHIGERPPGCFDECPCQKQGRRDLDGPIHLVCVDKKRFEGLRRAQQKAKKQRRNAQRDQHIQILEERIDGVTEITVRELAVLAAAAIKTVSKPTSLTLAGERLGVPAGPATEKSYGAEDASLEAYAALDPLTLVRFAVEAVLRDDVADIYGEYSVKSARVSYYLGDLPGDETEVAGE